MCNQQPTNPTHRKETTVPIEETHIVQITRDTQRRLQERSLDNNITGILAGSNNKSLAVSGWTVERYTGQEADTAEKGWTVDVEQVGGAAGKGQSNTVCHYSVWFLVSYRREDSKKPRKADLDAIIRKIHQRSSPDNMGGWKTATVDGNPYAVQEDTGDLVGDSYVGYADVTIPENIWEFFDDLYGLDPAITRVLRALEAAIMSDWENRKNCVLVGPPGCGKSAICAALKLALGDDAVIEYDATAMTSAGVIQDLTSREILPRVVVIEEAEKAPGKALEVFLAVLDQRGEIRKNTARVNIQRETKMFAVATVNNYALFKSMAAGALASRFTEKIGFRRPGREQLAQILTREVAKLGKKGDKRWVEATLQYGYDQKGKTDPRELQSIMLVGREMLLTGEYQKILEATDIDQIDEIADWSTLDVAAREESD